MDSGPAPSGASRNGGGDCCRNDGIGNCRLARLQQGFSCPFKLSYGLPFSCLIFYGDRESIGRKLNNSINIKGLAVAKSLWRLLCRAIFRSEGKPRRLTSVT